MATTKNPNLSSRLQLLFGVLLIASFFLPWVNWAGTEIKGMDMARGVFFKVTKARFDLENPFPIISFLFYIFWLIPALGALTVTMAVQKRKTIPYAFFAGALGLGLVTAYILFSRILIDLGAGNSVMGMLKPWIYLHAVSAAGLILSAFPVKHFAWKAGWLVIGPVLAFASFKIGEKYVLGQTHEQTQNVKADFTLTAPQLISEFLANDTAANNKYREKMLVVNGKVSSVEMLPDSSSTIKFADSTGSYAIFSFEKEQMDDVNKIKADAEVSLKGVCSGSIFSEILGTTSISFKRAAINKK